MARNEISRRLAAGEGRLHRSDVMDEDKSPEKLLLSDLDLAPWRPNLPPEEACLVFPARAVPLPRRRPARGATRPTASPRRRRERSPNDDGAFSSGMELLGFHPEPPDKGIRGDLLPRRLLETSAPVAGIYAGIFFLDPMLRRIGEAVPGTRWEVRSVPEKWGDGAPWCGAGGYLPPPLPQGLPIGLVGADGERIGCRGARRRQEA